MQAYHVGDLFSVKATQENGTICSFILKNH